HHLPMDAEEASIERWRAKRGGTSICVTFRVLTLDRKTRIEHIRVSTLAKQRTGKVVRIRSEFPLRLYTYHQTRSLFKKVPRLELCGIYDFHYDLEEPRKLDNDLEDALFVFRKRPE
ncbi:MAG: class I SAM-dependent methyltransferase, partial [Planctomycetota bacterium]